MRESLRCSLDVAAAAGIRAPVFVPGHIGERAARAHFRVADEQVVEVGNEWGFALDEALRRPFTDLLILGHPGKLAKLTAGDWDTHSAAREARFPSSRACMKKCSAAPRRRPRRSRGSSRALDAKEKKILGDALAAAVKKAVGARTEGRLTPAVVLIDLGGRIIGTAGDLKPWS